MSKSTVKVCEGVPGNDIPICTDLRLTNMDFGDVLDIFQIRDITSVGSVIPAKTLQKFRL